MTNQEAFNKVVTHLNQQRKAAVLVNASGHSKCSYAAPDGSACAVGCLLPRELGARLDNLQCSGTGWGGVVLNDLEEAAFQARKLLEGVNEELLTELQNTHDRLESLTGDEFWWRAKEKLIDIAAEHELELPPELQS